MQSEIERETDRYVEKERARARKERARAREREEERGRKRENFQCIYNKKSYIPIATIFILEYVIEIDKK